MIQINEDAPEWVHLLNQENPNVFDIKESYTAYYKSHPFVKNSYTQYYKRFMRWARPFMDGKGRISIPDPKTLATRERNILENRKSGNRTANWTFAGPNETSIRRNNQSDLANKYLQFGYCAIQCQYSICRW
ncbi:MAG: hypothetical protein IPN46_18110 [Saprospiraceae bacterium]|nr:hypothetical protein [Saprospiraceae bacterium]